MACIDISCAVRQYAPGRGVCNVSLSVEEGVCCALLGRNGSGKSTLTRLLLGLARPQSGRIAVFGNVVSEGSRNHLKRTGVVLDTSVHWDNLSGYDNAYFVARSYGLSHALVKERLINYLQAADLQEWADQPVAGYSYGMRRKLSIVQALSHEPDLLIMDEPTAGVDAHFLTRLTKMVQDRSLRGRTTWIAGNDPEWVSGVSAKVFFLDRGSIVAKGSVDDLVGETGSLSELRILLEGYTPIAPPPFSWVRSFVREGRVVTVFLDKETFLIPELVEWIVSHGGSIIRMETIGGTLRDAFLLKTGKTIEA
ncbi:MAG: ABC transporter ATP-binding protein [Deltaproteobacteria bacterium]|nr:ABC transporter ATP-binding protein [Deltaproteobacteria bacterium]